MLTAARLREVLDYDPATGFFTWKVTLSNRSVAGNVAGSIHRVSVRYLRIDISINNRLYRAHRLAWFYTYGKWPTFIDHIDGDSLNNAIANLREVSLAYNQQNRRRANHSNVGKLLGASYYKSRGNWMARIYVKGRQHFIGYFDTERDAHDAYMAAKRELHPGAVL